MALLKCAECGKDVSDKAEACPHCGAPKQTFVGAPDEAAAEQVKAHPAMAAGVWLFGVTLAVVVLTLGLSNDASGWPLYVGAAIALFAPALVAEHPLPSFFGFVVIGWVFGSYITGIGRMTGSTAEDTHYSSLTIPMAMVAWVCVYAVVWTIAKVVGSLPHQSEPES